MKISQMIKRLQEIKKEHGELPVLGGYLSDDRPPTSITVLDKQGCQFEKHGSVPIAGVFIE